jgi:GntR family transcriptional regulator/MocR family aminotransferase
MELPLEATAAPLAPMRRLSAFAERLRTIPAPPRRDRAALTIDFRYGDLAGSDFPTLAWKRAVNAAVAQRPGRLAYGDPRGSARLRHALQAYLWRARGIRCDPDQLIVVSGSQQGLDLCARLLLDAGDRFVMENPGYAKAHQVFAATGAAAVPIPVDDGGMDTSLLTGVDARLAYVTPSHQYPLGGVMPIARRRELLAWAQAAGACVIEDDYDSEYRYDIKPVLPLYGLGDAGTVLYLGTVSKTLSPTLRLGYLVVPSALQNTFSAAKDLADRHGPLIEQEALAAMLESGAYERHVRAVRRRNGERRTVLLGALRRVLGDNVSIEGADAGLHLVVWLHDLPRSAEGPLIDAAWRLGLGIYPVSPLYIAGHPSQPDRAGLVMGYAALDPARINRGVTLLRRAIASV